MRLLLREALQSFRRAPLLSVLSITTIAFSLFTIGLFGLVAINMRQALREDRKSVGEGKRVDLGGRRSSKKKKQTH